MCTRTSTQARSHAQKFFVKIEKRNQTLDAFLENLDLQNIENHLVFSDLEDAAEEFVPMAIQGARAQRDLSDQLSQIAEERVIAVPSPSKRGKGLKRERKPSSSNQSEDSSQHSQLA